MIFKQFKSREPQSKLFSSTELINYLLYVKEHENKFVTMQDIEALYCALQEAKIRYERHHSWLRVSQHLERLKELINDCRALKEESCRHKVREKQLISPVLRFIAELESSSYSKTMLSDLAKSQVMAITHQQSGFHGEIDSELQKTVNHSYWHSVLAALGVLFYLIVITVLPYSGLIIAANTIFSGSCAFFSAFICAGIESRFSASTCLPFMMLGNHYAELSVMKSNDEKAQAAAWMAINASSRSYYSSVVFMTAALVLSILFPFNAWPLVGLMVFSLVSQLAIELVLPFYSYRKQSLNNYLSCYQKQGIDCMQLTGAEKKAWLKCIKRKDLSLKAFYLSSTVSLAALSVATVFRAHLPFLFLTVFINTVVPTTLVITAAVIIFSAAMYLKRHHDSQVINRYALNFEKQSTSISEKEVRKKSLFHHTKWLFSHPDRRQKSSETTIAHDDQSPFKPSAGLIK